MNRSILKSKDKYVSQHGNEPNPNPAPKPKKAKNVIVEEPQLHEKNTPVIQTRSGRVVKKTQKYDD